MVTKSGKVINNNIMVKLPTLNKLFQQLKPGEQLTLTIESTQNGLHIKNSLHPPTKIYLVPEKAKKSYPVFMAWAKEQGIEEIGHAVVTYRGNKIYCKPVNINEFSKKTFKDGSEYDGSSFATGGLRKTDRSAAYAIPDFNAPWVIFPTKERGKTCYIMSTLIAHNGIAIDLRTPLIRATKVLNDKATKFLAALGIELKKDEEVILTAGAEQEGFIVPKKVVDQRPDLKHLRKTVVGKPGPINQQLQGVYLTQPALNEQALFNDIRQELAKVGIAATQIHLEVGQTGGEIKARQMEVVMKHTEATTAADQNLIAIQVIKDVCEKYGYVYLDNSKPFQGINGSGKHTHVSIEIRNKKTGQVMQNLLPMKKLFPTNDKMNLNLISLALLNAFKKHAALINASVASRSNEERRGGFEAPPVHLFAFAGPEERGDIEPDRNRTAPIGIAGNKFELRTPGSTTPLYLPIAFVAGALADVLNELTQQIIKLKDQGKDTKIIINELAKNLLEIELKDFLFDGNGYSHKWQEKAEKMWGKAFDNTPEAVKIYTDRDKTKFFSETGILSPEQLGALYNFIMEFYAKRVKAEADVLGDMTIKYLIPRAYTHPIFDMPKRMNGIDKKKKALANKIGQLYTLADKLRQKTRGLGKSEDFTQTEKDALKAAKEIRPLMKEVRNLYEEIEAELPHSSAPE